MKTALIGLGRMGLRHASVVEQCGLSLSSICDHNEGPRTQAGTDFSVSDEHQYSDPFAMLQTERPELVVIATTAPSHEELVTAAVENGAKKILCEKPMSTSIASCERMVALCDANNVELAVNHQMRFMEQYTLPKTMVDSDAYGGVASVIVSAGNFGMAMNGTHYFEMFRYITDEEPIRVSAWFDENDLSNPRGAQFKDAAGSIRLESASGKRFFMDCSADQGHGMFVTYNCRHGRISVDELSGSMSSAVRLEEHRSEPTTRYGMPYQTDEKTITPADAIAPTKKVMEALLAGENFPSGGDGLLAMKLLVAAHLSNDQGGTTIDLRSETLPKDKVLPVA